MNDTQISQMKDNSSAIHRKSHPKIKIIHLRVNLHSTLLSQTLQKKTNDSQHGRLQAMDAVLYNLLILIYAIIEKIVTQQDYQEIPFMKRRNQLKAPNNKQPLTENISW